MKISYFAEVLKMTGDYTAEMPVAIFDLLPIGLFGEFRDQPR